MAVGLISDRSVNVGDDVSVDDVSPYFSDPDGDVLAYTATSSNTGLATASVSGSTVTVTGVAEGSATITVTATDPAGLSATQSFDVTIQGGAPVVTGSITVCTGRQIAPGIPTYSIRIEGTITTDQDIIMVRLEGFANNESIGIDLLGNIAAGQTKSFSIGGVLSPGRFITTLRCSVNIDYRYRTGGGTVEQDRQATTSTPDRIGPIQ